MSSRDLVSRLRCQYAKGPIMENGEPEFGYADHSGIYTVELPTSLMLEAADYIEAATSRQQERIRVLEDALRGMVRHFWVAGSEDEWGAIKKAEQALSATAREG